LTSSGQNSEGEKFAALGFAGYLLKPIIQHDLIDCLSAVMNGTAEDWHTQTNPIITRQYLQERRGCETRRILVAEDDGVNRMVAVHLLKRLGYQVDAVNDGREAVAAWQSERYDLIVMDCQMPVLDGYRATREIRSLETDGRHIPIIALTANAMPDAERQCKAAGMDAYIAKPIDRDQLEACLDRYFVEDAGPSRAGPQRQDRLAAPAGAADQENAPVDLNALRLLAAGDPEFQRELVQTFIETGNTALEQIEQALERGDTAELARTAHTVKGASAHMRASAVTGCAARLETAARRGDGQSVPELAGALRGSLEEAMEFLRARQA
jgi:CheY-like chemotaxis protein